MSPVSSTTSTPSSAPRCSTTYSRRSRRPRPGPTTRAPADAASHLGWRPRPVRRSTSGSPSTAPPTSPRGKRGHADAARPEETCPRSDPSTHPGPAATSRGLRCGTRPPQDHLLSSQTRIIKRWPSRTPDRHANSMITIYGWSTRPPGSHLGGPGLRRRHGELVALDDVREPFGLRHWDLVAVHELDELRHLCFAALGQVDDRPEELFESGR
jgi:hypothetical protein